MGWKVADQEINTGGGSAIQGNVNTGGGDAVLRDQAENTQRNNVNISLGNREWLEIIDYKLTRLNDNFEYRLSRIEDQINSRLRNVERDIQQMQRDIDQAKTDGANGNLKRIFWALVGLGLIITVLLSVLIVLLSRGSTWLP